MKYCIKCGSELRGAKNFCMACGAKQDRLKKEKAEQVTEKAIKKDKVVNSGKCIKCDEETEKKCFFCESWICRDHYLRMQANKFPNEELMGYRAEGNTKKVNEGWRGFIISACPRCASMKHTRGLTPGEADKIKVFDHCSWYKLD
jgi:hypothetical protein